MNQTGLNLAQLSPACLLLWTDRQTGWLLDKQLFTFKIATFLKSHYRKYLLYICQPLNLLKWKTKSYIKLLESKVTFICINSFVLMFSVIFNCFYLSNGIALVVLQLTTFEHLFFLEDPKLNEILQKMKTLTNWNMVCKNVDFGSYFSFILFVALQLPNCIEKCALVSSGQRRTLENRV